MTRRTDAQVDVLETYRQYRRDGERPIPAATAVRNLFANLVATVAVQGRIDTGWVERFRYADAMVNHIVQRTGHPGVTLRTLTTVAS